MIYSLEVWFVESWWAWKNCAYFRFDGYEDNIDRCAFFEELNRGYIQMRDEHIMRGLHPPYTNYNEL